MGPGTLNIAGTGGINATVGTDQNGIVYAKSGFATPFINIGPSINALDPGAIGGWVIGPTGTYGTSNYDLILQQKSLGAAVPAGLEGPVYSLTNPPSSISYMLGNSPYATSSNMLTTTIGTAQTAIYELGPTTTTATTKLLVMANASYYGKKHGVQLTVGRASSSGASASSSTNIVTGTTPVTLPSAGTTAFYMAAFPAAGSADDHLNIQGFALDSPGAGTFYYTVWLCSSVSENYSNIIAALTVLKIQA